MARKSKKVDFININDLGGQTTADPVPIKNACYKTALYARLSEETEANRERATIQTQMDLLRRFVAENDDMVVSKEYADISYSGANFERPAFEEMVRDMRDGRFNCIVVKDLSRLGRNYVETGNYIERVFPFFGVRFIAITDGYDSNKSGEELLMPLKNMVNEMYIKDLSKKAKSAHRAYWKNGEYSSGSVPYGYIRADRHLIPDDAVRENVEEIFRLYLEGCPIKAIARKLSEKAVSPSAYKKMLYFGQEIPNGVHTAWSRATVHKILKNPVYAGSSVHNKYVLIGGKQIVPPKEEWMIFEDTHEPLVSKEVFHKVQERLEDSSRRFNSISVERGYNHARFNLLGKKIVCAECGRSLGFRAEGAKHNKKYYRCRTYLADAHGKCKSHKVSLEEVNQSVFNAIHEHMKICIDKEKTVRRMNAKTNNIKKYDTYGKEAERIRRELRKATEVKAGIFEDYREKLIDEEQYVQISEKYAGKIEALKKKLDEILKVQAAYSKEYHIDENWKAVVEQHLNKRSLTREMVEAFVEKAVVYENAKIEVYLKYDDVLNDLKNLSMEREAG